MDKVRIGIIGLGNMGSAHLKNFLNGDVKRATVKAVCDLKQSRLDWAKALLGNDAEYFLDADELIQSGLVDAIVIATPHYLHPVYAIAGLKQNLHTMVEKPAGVYTKQIIQMNEQAQKKQDIVFGIMFNQRTNPIYIKARELVQSGELGKLKRVNWIITDWYRTQTYYNSSEWRATWEGEGGGVLMNQSPHQLDLLQWICGMPKRVRAFCSEGKFHNIEVEDDVTAFMEYENGATAVFVTSTGDVPGTNRLEILGDKGRIIIENEKLEFWSLRVPESEFNKTSTKSFATPEVWKCDIPISQTNPQHVGVLNNFVKAILDGESLISDGCEGIKSVELANAMYMSSWLESFVDIPLDSEKYYDMLNERIKKSTFKKIVKEQIAELDETY